MEARVYDAETGAVIGTFAGTEDEILRKAWAVSPTSELSYTDLDSGAGVLPTHLRRQAVSLLYLVLVFDAATIDAYGCVRLLSGQYLTQRQCDAVAVVLDCLHGGRQ